MSVLFTPTNKVHNVSDKVSTVSKADLIEQIAKKLDLSKADVKRVLEAEHEAITKAVKKGARVSVSGFGIFSLRKRAARKGRNPATGAAIKVKASKSVAFKPSKSVKDAL